MRRKLKTAPDQGEPGEENDISVHVCQVVIRGLGGQAAGKQKRRRQRQTPSHHAAAVSTGPGTGKGVTRRAVPAWGRASCSARSNRLMPSQCWSTLLKRNPAARSGAVASLGSAAGKVRTTGS